MRRLRSYAQIAVPFAIAAIAIALYLPSLGYGFMYDDPLDLPRATDRAFLELLTSAGATMYYRPLPLVIWRFLHDLLGRNDGVALHALVVALHAANGALVYLLGRRLYRGVAAGLVAGALFVTFPFSYQAVMHTATTYHPLATFCALGAIVTYLAWRDSQRRALLSSSLLFAALAMLAHEYGVVVATLAFGIEAFWLAEKRGRRPSPAVLAFAGLALGYLALWASAPKWGQSLALFGSARQNLAYFLQAIAWPLADRLDRLPLPAGLSPTLVVATAALATILSLGLLALSARRASAFALAGFWAVSAFAPTLALLSYSYVVDGPRLLYLASAGICLAWAGGLTAPFGWKLQSPLPRWGSGVGGVRSAVGLAGLLLAALIAGRSASFIAARAPVFAAGADVVRQVVATASDGTRPGRTYVNVPSWLALKSSDYPLGHSGAAIIPNYIGLGRVVYIVTGEQPEIASLTVEALKRDWGLYYEPHGPVASPDEVESAYRRGGGVYIARYDDARVALEYVGEVRAATPASNRLVASFGEWLWLASADTARSPERLDVTLQWEASAAPRRDETVLLHVYDGAGKLVAQADGYPLGDTLPLRRLRPGDEVIDVRRVALPPDLPAGEYRLAVGIYDRASGARAPATDARGMPFRDDAAIVATLRLP